ncbi:ABC transporter ATP-binding protein [Natronobacterium gregoryi]|uniref:ABC transporter n=2 Tax=Natronobacterium gregoryi TaxID=44930 RepID=L0AEQ2_NATGS|nr:ABC transporter ATP-binding protein [Natronobacterium gregoryi]AFZ71914.1 ABC-type multidrug transport system, ATPase component [Natronobacterium gregoryi SP2]ELY62465.1 ABC transporter [Natronobacterium gregoryi SP2]PLK20743.1 ABC transporter ATP-binding protein [Natronobacterium gregoryi SP2]SFJ14104.1 ABC-2 type transport system ATP-binding protein [Natronobacterium gregoryi]
MPTIEIADLTKRYGDVVANDAVTFDVESGEIFGYLGPNGAGKTTTIRLLLGLITPTSGTAEVLGADIRDRRALTEAKASIGYLPDTLGFEERLTGRQALDYFARMRGDERRDELLELFPPPLEKPIETYSAGNRRMLGIVQAFMHDPDLAILDEPTSGLDPLKQDRMHAFLEEERDAGKTIFFSSHVLSEVQRVCDRVGIIREGKLVALEEIDDLLQRSGKQVRVQLAESVEEDGFVTPEMIDVETVDATVRFTYTGESADLLEHLVQYEVEDVDIGDPQLDDIFKHYYGDEPAEAG